MELGSTGIMLWSGILLFLLVWIFALGILVGRGSLPGDIRGVTEWKEQMGRLQGLVRGDEAEEEKAEEPPVEGPKLAFYEKLTTKKDEARERKSAKPKVRPKKPAQREAPLSTLPSTRKDPAVSRPSKERGSLSEASGEAVRKPPAAPPAATERPAPKARTGSSRQTGGRDLLTVKAQFTVQVAAMETREAADEMIERLNRKGYPSYYYDVTIRGKTYYRIRCGRFLSRSQAEEHAALLARKEGIRGFVSKLD